MRTTCSALTCLFLCALGAAGCYESLTSIATPDKLVFYDDLPGDYKAVAPATGRLSIGKGEGKAFAYKQYDEKGGLQNKGALRIVKIGDEHFYEITIDGFQTSEGKPIYAVGRLAIGGKAGAKTLTGYAFKSKDAFFSDPGVTTAEYTSKENGEVKKARALSMPPEKLQAYLAAHAKEMTEPTLKFQQAAAAG